MKVFIVKLFYYITKGIIFSLKKKKKKQLTLIELFFKWSAKTICKYLEFIATLIKTSE